MNQPDDLWQDDRHWKAGIIYFCRDDPRLIVPKRLSGTGWTLNFARPVAYIPFIIGIAAILWALIWAV